MAEIQNGDRKSYAIYYIYNKFCRQFLRIKKAMLFLTDSSALILCFENNVDTQIIVSVALMQINTKYIAF